MHTEERVMDIVHQYNSDAKLSDRLVDDLWFYYHDMYEIVTRIENEFGISITDDELEDSMWCTAKVQDLIDFVDRKLDERRIKR